MSRSATLEGFRPSFVAVATPQLRALFKAAYADGMNVLSGEVDVGQNEFVHKGQVPLSDGELPGAHWINFGFSPSGSDNGVRSEDLLYRLEVKFDAGQDTLTSVKLTIYLLNPRFVLSRGAFVPANCADEGAAGTCRFDPLTSSADCVSGIELVADGPLATPLQLADFAVPGVLRDFLELTLTWSTVGSSWLPDALEEIVAIPGGALAAGFAHRFRLYCAELENGTEFEALLHESNRFAVVIVDDLDVGIELILEPPKKPTNSTSPGYAEALARWEAFLPLRHEFGLSESFKGLIFEGLSAHFLDDDLRGYSDTQITVGKSAIAFGGTTLQSKGETTRWYTSLQVGIRADAPPLFGMLKPAGEFKLSIDESIVRYVSLTGTFVDNANPGLQWLSGKDAVISVIRYPWKDADGQDKADWVLELALVGDRSRVIARVDTGPGGLDQATLDTLVMALAFGPLVLRMDPIDVNTTLPAPDARTRGYFVEVQPGLLAATAAAAVTFGQVFKEAISARELRVTGIYLRDQPLRINHPTASGGRQAALLFDYEADYAVDLSQSSTRASFVCTRVQGTGLSFSRGGEEGDRFAWVQVPNGLYELSMGDPGLWELNGLGKLLRVSQVSVRKVNGHPELVVRLKLAGNLGIIEADDFVFSLDMVEESATLESYPSKVKMALGKTVTATGVLVIADSASVAGAKDVIGSLDLLVAKGDVTLRVFAGLRVTRVKNTAGDPKLAVLAGASVSFPKALPIGASGLGIGGLEGLFAMHFKRLESAAVGAVPPALQWLKDAGGDVAGSIDDTELWEPAYDRWSFGLGTTLVNMANAKLFNLNGMFVLELPGPKILVFVKLNVLKPPIGNPDDPARLTSGVLGVLQIDLDKGQITLAVILDLELKSFIQLRAPLEVFFDLKTGSNWHFLLGTYDRPATATLDLPGLPKIGIEFYFMAAGHALNVAGVNLPGTALATGIHCFLKIGDSKLYLKVDARADLAVSFSNNLLVYGQISLSGELNLWGASVGASGVLDFKVFKTNPYPPNWVHGYGEICGKVKLVFVELEGCVSIHFGEEQAPVLAMPDLVQEVALVSGIDVAKFGQGLHGPIDGKLGTAAPKALVPAHQTSTPNIPIDCVIAIGMFAPPGAAAASGFSAAPDARVFNFGGVEGRYELTGVTLTPALQGSNTPQDIPWCWWRTEALPAGGQPSPTSLALFSRNPFAVANAMPASEDLQHWLDAMAGTNPCGETLPPQDCLYHFTASDLGGGDDGSWTRPGVLCSPDTEQQIGRTGVCDLIVTVEQHDNLPEALKGMLLRPGVCVPELGSNGIAYVLKLNALTLQAGQGTENVPLRAEFVGKGLRSAQPVRLLLAVPEDVNVVIEVRDGNGGWHASGGVVWQGLGDLLPAAQTTYLEDFHGECPNWKPVAEAFAALGSEPRCGQLVFQGVDIGLLGVTDPTGISLSFQASHGVRETIWIGAVKWSPLAEAQRFDAQESSRTQLLGDIRAMFGADPVPLLEPNTAYTIDIAYQKWKSDLTAPPASDIQSFLFTTAADPPRSLTPYLLTSFPSPGEAFHFTGDMPGIVLASDLILRVLSKHGAALKVTITNDGDQRVTNSDATIEWSGEGRVFDPLTLNAAQAPPGIQLRPVTSLPSAIKLALMARLAGGGLPCLVGDLAHPATALWIGFDVALKPLTGYALRIEVVKPDLATNPVSHAPWVWPAAGGPPKGTADPFFACTFRTSLYASTRAHARALRGALPRHRLLLAPLSIGAGPASLTVLAEKTFEDALAAATGERSTRTGSPRVTVLWSPKQAELEPLAVLIEANEPLVRNAWLPEVVGIGGGALKVSDLVERAYSLPAIDSAARVASGVLTSGACSLLLWLHSDSGGDMFLKLVDTPLDRLPRAHEADEPETAVFLPERALARRVLPVMS